MGKESELHEIINRLTLAAAALEGMTEIMAVNRQDMITVLLAADRAEAAETALLRVERYGADQWRRGNACKDPQEFDEWLREQA